MTGRRAVAVCLLAWRSLRSLRDAAELRDQVRTYRVAHEKEIVRELADLLALPNVATRGLADIERNADHLTGMLERRGFAVQRLSAGEGTPPALYGDLQGPGGEADADVLRPLRRPAGGPEGLGLRSLEAHSSVPVRSATGSRKWTWRPSPDPMNPEWRIFARSASDDKSPIVAILAALDALRAAGRQPTVNVKLFLEGEEEQGSPHLTEILRKHAGLLTADAWVLCDGPVHPTRRMQVYYGARGVTGLDLTVYGPVRPLHSGHYGNWAPNPAVTLAHLVATLRDEEGRILIPGFYDDVRPLNEAEKRAIGRHARRGGGARGASSAWAGQKARRKRASPGPDHGPGAQRARPALGRGGRRGGQRHPHGSPGVDRLPPGAGPDARRRSRSGSRPSCAPRAGISWRRRRTWRRGGPIPGSPASSGRSTIRRPART